VNILDLLKNDHKMVAQLIDEVQQCEPGDEKLDQLAQQISQALTVHAALEESLFYPELRERSEDDDERVDVFEAFTEHDVVKHLISLLKGGRKEDALFKAELQVLGENVKHHVREEESTIFALARELMEEQELEELGATAQAEKERLMRPQRRGPGRKKQSQAGARGGKKAAAKKTTARKSTSRKSASRKSTARKGGGRKNR
jgi:hemerythrin superfamily protein